MKKTFTIFLFIFLITNAHAQTREIDSRLWKSLNLHFWLGDLTHHLPVLMLLIMVCVAVLLVPLHHKLEHWITHNSLRRTKK